MKASVFAKRLGISLLLGIALTFAIGGLKYAWEKPSFNPRAACKGNPLCDPSPYLSIGFPWAYGVFDDSSGRTLVLHITNDPYTEDEERIARHYRNFVYDVALYSGLTLVALVLWPRLRPKHPRAR